MEKTDEELESAFSALLAEAKKKGNGELGEFVAVFHDSATTQAACLTRQIVLVPNTALKVLWETRGLAVKGNPLHMYFGYWRNQMAVESLNLFQEVADHFPKAADIQNAQVRLILALGEMVVSYE